MLQINDSSVGLKMANYSNGHSSNTGPVKKSGILDHIWLHICVNLWIKIPNFGGVKKIRQRFGKMEPLDSKPHQMPWVCHTPPKMVPPYSLGTCPSKTPPEHFDAPLLLHQEKIDLLKTLDFGQSTQMAGVAKNWHMSKLTKRGPRRRLKLSWDQIWQKIPMGSVTNCRKEIANCYGIRWFKCKL